MLRKLMIMILGGVIFWGFFASNILAGTPGKITPQKIPVDQIVPSSPTPLNGDKGFCSIQSDSGTPAYYMATLGAGDRIALYMDPTTCGVQNPYPFKVTDVHFYLDNFGGATWPVEIKVNIRDLFQGYKCNGPGNLLCSQTYTIPIDSAYPIMIHLDLDSLCCVYAPFFLEIEYTGGTSSPYPSLLLTDGITNPTDTCDVWFFREESYQEWYVFFGSGIGYPIMRITGYTQQCHPESCWYWKADRPNQEFPVPSGMPDFGQYQFDDSLGLCGPAAVANCLWWFNAVPPGVKPDSLIRLLSTYFHTHPDSGTCVDSILSGLNRYFGNYGFSLYAHKFTQPEFYAMEDSLKRSQDIILLLGFWQSTLLPPKGVPPWIRFGGHYVTMAGVCSDSQKVALSDPARDAAEHGWPGRVPVPHPPHTDGDTVHNSPQFVSHDIYQAILPPQSQSPGGIWELDNYYYLPDKMPPPFQGQNFQPTQFYSPYIPFEPVYTEVEYAIMICPSNWYWKPDRPDQDHPAPSGMPDFDQNQDEWQSYCGPTAVANCLWWYNAVPERWTPPQLIDTLAARMHCRPEWGTYVDTMQMALDQYFQDYGFALQESTFQMPNFFEMEDSLKKCQDIILLLGFWYFDADSQKWFRAGGHFVTMAGVCSESTKIALSDPDRDNAESGGAGRVRPPHAQHPADDTLHNDPTYVSHDIYNSMQSPSPGNPDWGIDYIVPRGKYSGINVPKEFISVTKSAPKDDVAVYYTEVEYAVMICPKPTAVEEEEEGSITPKDFELYQSYPNPFNNQTIIKYDLLKSCQVSLTIYNILGQKVKTLVKERQAAGSKTVSWDGKDEKGKDLASGIYFYQLKAGEVTQTKRMVLLK
jgi:hypothetical protein